MLLPLLCGAQVPPIKPLTIGDTVPDIVFNHVINYKDKKIQVSQFKGKLVILDFWATTCMSCIYGFAKSDSLQYQFKDSIQIILVNPEISRDSLAKVNRTLQRFVINRGVALHLPIALYDRQAYALFPFHYLPNLVWIGSDGIVKAITGAQELTVENIREVLKGKDAGMALKKD